MDHMSHMGGSYHLPLPAQPGQPLSEFNHHMAGLVVLITGVSSLLMIARPGKYRFLSFVWPASILLLGVYLVLYSDPEAWPCGTLGLGDSLRDIEVQQHKVYALLLLLMGGIEMARAGGIVRSPKWRYAFPALAAAGALYLIVHRHGGESMHDMPGMGDSVHLLIMRQHALYIVLGLGIAVTRVMANMRRYSGTWVIYLWPTLTGLLGVALLMYRE